MTTAVTIFTVIAAIAGLAVLGNALLEISFNRTRRRLAKEAEDLYRNPTPIMVPRYCDYCGATLIDENGTVYEWYNTVTSRRKRVEEVEHEGERVWIVEYPDVCHRENCVEGVLSKYPPLKLDHERLKRRNHGS